MKIFKYSDIIKESNELREYNKLLKNLGFTKSHFNDPKKSTNMINDFLSKDENKKKFLKEYDKINDEIDVEKTKIKAKDLLPSQNNIFIEKVLDKLFKKEKKIEKILKGKFKNYNILVSSDNYIIDGHHRWAMTFIINPNCKLKCTSINLPIKYAIPIINAVLKSNKIYNKDVNKKNETNIYNLSKKELIKKLENIQDINSKIKKSIIKNILKLNNPPSFYINRKDMPKIKEKEAKKLLS